MTRETVLEKNEIVTEVLLPAAEPGLRSSYRKVRGRGAWDFALAGVALAVLMKDGKVARARVGLLGCGPGAVAVGGGRAGDHREGPDAGGRRRGGRGRREGRRAAREERLQGAAVQGRHRRGAAGALYGAPQPIPGVAPMSDISAELLSASTIAIRDCMGAKAGERVLVVTDEPLRAIGFALQRAARDLGHEVLLVDMLPRKSNGEEPPPEVADLMKRFDVVLCPTSKSLTHTDSRRAASAAGARVATLPGVTEAIMVRCMNADYDEIAARTYRALRDAREDADRPRDRAGRHRHRDADRGTRRRTRVPGCSGRKGSRATCRRARRTSRRSRALSNGVVVVDGSMAGVGMVTRAAPHRRRGRLRDGDHGRAGGAETDRACSSRTARTRAPWPSSGSARTTRPS